MNWQGRGEIDEDTGDGLTFLAVIRLGPGLLLLLALAAYSLVQAMPEKVPTPQVIGGGSLAQIPAVTLQQGPVYIGGKAFYPPPPADGQYIIHFACDSEDARIVRIFDPAPTGLGIILRLDQSADDMRALYRGDKLEFPADSRVVTSSCMQALIDYGEFP